MNALLYLIPTNYLSAITGRLAYLPLPTWLRVQLIKWFSKRYGVALEEAEHDAARYTSLGDFFTRNLKPGLRPVGEGIVSPVDGAISEFGEIDNGRLIQVKGITYQVADLLRDTELSKRFERGYFITFYLAPGDYHHIHTPVSGRITQAIHIEGALWPVNTWGLANIDGLFVQNERIISVVESDIGAVAVVKVGATNVGSIVTQYAPIEANKNLGLFRARSEVHRYRFSEPPSCERGDRLGTFRMGSSVVLLFEAHSFEAGQNCCAGPISVRCESIKISKRSTH